MRRLSVRGAGVIILLLMLLGAGGFLALPAWADDRFPAEKTGWRPGDEIGVARACPSLTDVMLSMLVWRSGDDKLAIEIIATRCTVAVTASGGPARAPGVLRERVSGSVCRDDVCLSAWRVEIDGATFYLPLPDEAGPHGGVPA